MSCSLENHRKGAKDAKIVLQTLFIPAMWLEHTMDDALGKVAQADGLRYVSQSSHFSLVWLPGRGWLSGKCGREMSSRATL
ncbi:MAG: hypothetical protein D6723_18600 [Acidobacteria bacterium]|nr:MAG: hypothetical protein D6723_18600 [Acidobacteriota bacterium]